MQKGKEVELKLRVSGWEDLLAVGQTAGGDLEVLSPVRQINHFFDASNLKLREAGYSVRLRQEDRAYILTFKGPHPDATMGSTLAIRLEEEIPLSAVEGKGILEGSSSALKVMEGYTPEGPEFDARRALIKTMRTHLDGQALRYKGCFENLRWRLPFWVEDHALELELDRTLFPGDVIHHEVELEIPADVDAEQAEARLRLLFEKAGVEGSSAPGKASRFFASLLGQPIP
jgi:uncharacterized protein YjbK